MANKPKKGTVAPSSGEHTVVIRKRDPNEPPKLRKPKPLLNPKQVRMKLLALLREVRPAYADQITRVSPEAITTLEGDLLNCMKSRLRQIPSVGKTLKFE